jgi:hypothetical protein
MKRFYTLLLAALALSALPVASAQATDFFMGDAQVVGQFSANSPQAFAPLVAVADYSNITNFLGSAVTQGPSANQAGNQITRLLADDITPTGIHAGQQVSTVTFSVVNLNPVQVSARPRIRFWFADGAAGAPGTYYNVPAAVGFTFNAFTMPPNSVTLLTGTLGAGTFTMPGGTFWAGMTFDNNTGATGATAAQMDNLGQGFFDPPTVGASADVMFLTQGAGSFFPTANPAGALLNLGGDPVANLAWEFTVEVAVPTQATTLGHIKSLYR